MKRITAMLLFVVSTLHLSVATLHAQDDREWREWEDLRPIGVDEPDFEGTAPADEREQVVDGRPRPILLREGSFLIEAVGSLQYDPETGWWEFVLDEDDPTKPGHRLYLVPTRLFGEMTRLVESLPGEQVTFEASGMVLAYRGRNFFLPTHAPRLVRYEYVPEPADDDAPQPDPDQPRQADDPDRLWDDDPIRRIERQLERAVGGVPQTPVDSRSRRVLDLEPGLTLPGEGERGRDEPGLTDGSLTVQRRGRIVRDHQGAWVFVFDSDATGTQDPPLVILPGRQLLEIEQHARRRGLPMEVLISGTVYVHDNRRYLLPTRYQFPRERSGLSR